MKWGSREGLLKEGVITMDWNMEEQSGQSMVGRGIE